MISRDDVAVVCVTVGVLEQMGQFAFILVQSVMAYLEGPSCGSPDFSKLLMMGYMGSMLVLFSDFFIKRYILKKPAYDMCGESVDMPVTGSSVVLSPFRETSMPSARTESRDLNGCVHCDLLLRSGVIKSVEFTGGPITSTYHGNAKLNGAGQALVRMPRHFTDVSYERVLPSHDPDMTAFSPPPLIWERRRRSGRLED